MTGSTRRFNPEDTSKPKLWTAKICPFAAKAIISFTEIGVDYDTVDVDLLNKPASLFEVNPKGQIPALLDQGNCINDSYNVVQYIDEMWARSDNKSFMPVEPAKRALARTWCNYIIANVIPPFYGVLLKKGPEDQASEKAKLLNGLKTLNDTMKSISDGPFFMGDQFTVVDIMLAPHVDRFPALKHFRGFEVPETNEYERFRTWWNAVKEYPSFKTVKLSEEYVIQGYAPAANK